MDCFTEFEKLGVFSGLNFRERKGTGEIEVEVGAEWRLPEEVELEILCECKKALQKQFPNDPDTDYVAITVPRKC